jgi:hypothetical protein
MALLASPLPTIELALSMFVFRTAPSIHQTIRFSAEIFVPLRFLRADVGGPAPAGSKIPQQRGRRSRPGRGPDSAVRPPSFVLSSSCSSLFSVTGRRRSRSSGARGSESSQDLGAQPSPRPHVGAKIGLQPRNRVRYFARPHLNNGIFTARGIRPVGLGPPSPVAHPPESAGRAGITGRAFFGGFFGSPARPQVPLRGPRVPHQRGRRSRTSGVEDPVEDGAQIPPFVLGPRSSPRIVPHCFLRAQVGDPTFGGTGDPAPAGSKIPPTVLSSSCSSLFF